MNQSPCEIVMGLDLGIGQIIYCEDLSSRKEDMLQVQYPGRQLIDLGWYPEGSSEGAFTVLVIREYRWDVPALQITTSLEDEVVGLLMKAVAFVQSEITQNQISK